MGRIGETLLDWWDMLPWYGWLIVGTILLGGTFLVGDYAYGQDYATVATVEAHDYRPAWTQVVVHSSKDSTWVENIYHPEEFRLRLRTEKGICSKRVDGGYYHSVRDGAQRAVTLRMGLWTKSIRGVRFHQ